MANRKGNDSPLSCRRLLQTPFEKQTDSPEWSDSAANVPKSADLLALFKWPAARLPGPRLSSSLQRSDARPNANRIRDSAPRQDDCPHCPFEPTGQRDKAARSVRHKDAIRNSWKRPPWSGTLAEVQRVRRKTAPYADQRIKLDLDDGVKVNYGKFGDLLAEVKAVTGGSADE